MLPSQSGWYWGALGEGEAGLAVTVVDPDESSSLVSPTSTEHTSPPAVTTPRPKVVSTSISPATTELSRAGRKGKADIRWWTSMGGWFWGKYKTNHKPQYNGIR